MTGVQTCALPISTGLKLSPISAMPATTVVTDLINFASSLRSYAESNGYQDISNLADSLSGEAAKTKYLLTLS